MMLRPLTDSVGSLEVAQRENRRPSKTFLYLFIIVTFILLTIIIVSITLLQNSHQNENSVDRSIKVLLIGGFHSPANSSMEYYYPYQAQHDSLINVSMMTPRFFHTSIVMSDGKIMTMGGFTISHPTNNVEIYDPISNKVTQGTNMNIARCGCDSAIIEGIVYVCGGYDGDNHLSSCERYQFGVWDNITSMGKARFLLRLKSLNGCLYAIGGYDGTFREILNSVEKFNPRSNSWMVVKSLQIRRYGHGAAVMNGFIYVCDGLGSFLSRTHSCERYDPGLNQWSKINETIVNREGGLSMISDGQNLFAFGGSSKTNSSHSVEMYDPNKKNWTLIKTLIHGRTCSSVVVFR